MNIIIERPDDKPQRRQGGGGCSILGIGLALIAMGLAHWATSGIESPIFWVGWIVFFAWLEWFLIVKCGHRPHWWGGA